MGALVTAGLVTAGSASAYHFTPSGTRFHLTGTVTLTAPQGSVSCPVQAAGVNTGVKQNARIRLWQFGQPCDTKPDLIGASGLPWPVTPTSATTARISGFNFMGPAFGPCGPGYVRVTVEPNGVWHLEANKLPGGCTLKGPVTTSPAMTIIP
jgi:hypothetical protein